MATNAQRSSASISEYSLGGLSKFPAELDTEKDLYVVGNRIAAQLIAGVSPSSEIMFLDDDAGFPPSGILKIDKEYVFYSAVKDRVISGLIRGFSTSDPMEHPRGSMVDLVIMADHHNALRDAVYNLEQKVGLRTAQANVDGNLSERVAYLRAKWYTPRALWFVKPKRGAAPLRVQFVSFSRGFPNAYYWSFGDGSTASGNDENAMNPVHVYEKPGTYNVSLTIFTARRGSAQAYKIGQVEVLNESDFIAPIIWAEVYDASVGRYVQGVRGRVPLTVRLTDQTDGKIVRRVWNFDDGSSEAVEDPYKIDVEHTYLEVGQYQPSLFLQVGDYKTINLRLPYVIEVLD